MTTAETCWFCEGVVEGNDETFFSLPWRLFLLAHTACYREVMLNEPPGQENDMTVEVAVILWPALSHKGSANPSLNRLGPVRG